MKQMKKFNNSIDDNDWFIEQVWGYEKLLNNEKIYQERDFGEFSGKESNLEYNSLLIFEVGQVIDCIIEKLCINENKIKKLDKNKESINCICKQNKIKICGEIKKWASIFFHAQTLKGLNAVGICNRRMINFCIRHSLVLAQYSISSIETHIKKHCKNDISAIKIIAKINLENE